MTTKIVLISLLLLQLSATAFSGHRPHGGHHKQPVTHELGGPAGGIPGGLAEGIPSQPGGLAMGISTPSAATRGAQGSGKKWCIGKQNIKKGLLKKAFEQLCKEVDCSPTGPKGLCYDESIWSKASYAMNLKYQHNGKKDFDCDHEGIAEIVTIDPSWGKCVLISS